MHYQLLISDETRLDIFDGFLWYEQQREGLGFDFELCLEAGLAYIQRNPLSRQIKYDEIRIHFIQKFPYGVHYLVEKDIVRILGVFHTRKDPKSWRERLK